MFIVNFPVTISGLIRLLALDCFGRRPDLLLARRLEPEYRHSRPYQSPRQITGGPPRGNNILLRNPGFTYSSKV